MKVRQHRRTASFLLHVLVALALIPLQANLIASAGTPPSTRLTIIPPSLPCGAVFVPVKGLSRTEMREIFIIDPLERGEFIPDNSNHHQDWLDWKPPSIYREARHILFLSDGASGLAELLPLKVPEAYIYKTDLEIDEHFTRGKLRALPMDNTEIFPFPDGSMDLVLLRQGLCRCDGIECCAGFGADSDLAVHFFREIARVMNPNSQSNAYLEGGARVNKTHIEFWIKALLEIQKSLPNLRFEILVHKDRGNAFSGLHLFMHPGKLY